MQSIALPSPGVGKRWYRIIDTNLPAGQDFADDGKEIALSPSDCYLANPRSTVVLVGR